VAVKLTWVNVDEIDEPRYGDRWSVQEHDNGQPLYKIRNRWRGTSALRSWRVYRGDDESHVADGDTLSHAKSIAQDDYDNTERNQ
jgi:hypothetical protein